MTPDDIAHCKTALEAAAEHVISALGKLEDSPVTFSAINACANTTSGVGAETAKKIVVGGNGYSVFISSTFSSLEKERHLLLELFDQLFYDQLIGHKTACVVDFGIASSHGKSTTADLIKGLYDSPLYHKAPSLLAAVLGESSEEKAMNDFVEHAVIGYLNNGDAVGLAKLNAALPADDEHIIEVPQFERTDAAIHADSIFDFNGRSLDSHNPWHLSQSFESFLDEELSHSAHSTMAKKAAKAGGDATAPPIITYQEAAPKKLWDYIKKNELQDAKNSAPHNIDVANWFIGDPEAAFHLPAAGHVDPYPVHQHMGNFLIPYTTVVGRRQRRAAPPPLHLCGE